MPETERFFNTAGPVFPADHYCVPPLERFDLDENKSWEEKIYRRAESRGDRTVTVWGA